MAPCGVSFVWTQVFLDLAASRNGGVFWKAGMVHVGLGALLEYGCGQGDEDEDAECPDPPGTGGLWSYF
jgi:hypothetical protein